MPTDAQSYFSSVSAQNTAYCTSTAVNSIGGNGHGSGLSPGAKGGVAVGSIAGAAVIVIVVITILKITIFTGVGAGAGGMAAGLLPPPRLLGVEEWLDLEERVVRSEFIFRREWGGNEKNEPSIRAQ
jgi:hypothetical protein